MDWYLERDWLEVLETELRQEYFLQIKTTIEQRISKGAIVYPPLNLIFNAFNLTRLDSLRVVILGQDPYCAPSQAMGLSFSVPRGVRIPPSLYNIFLELQSQIDGFVMPRHGDLSSWARQGILLLNSSLSVEKGVPNSHKNINWAQFVDNVLKILIAQKENLIFLLWGNAAKSKRWVIAPNGYHVLECSSKHLLLQTKVSQATNSHFILEAAHPSPLARGAFFGCKHFLKTNEILISIGKTSIDWNLDEF